MPRPCNAVDCSWSFKMFIRVGNLRELYHKNIKTTLSQCCKSNKDRSHLLRAGLVGELGNYKLSASKHE